MSEPDEPTLPYDDFLAELSTYKRSNVIAVAAHLLWGLWNKPEHKQIPMNRPVRRDAHFCCAFAARIAALACGVCAEEGRTLDGPGLIALCHKYHSIQERTLEQELALLRVALHERAALAPLLASEPALRLIAAFMPAHRAIRGQNPLNAGLHDLLRPWHILKLADIRAQRDGRRILEQAPSVLAGLTIPQFLSVGLAYFSLAAKVQVEGNGLDIRACWSTDGFDTKLGLTTDDVLTVADRLSSSATEVAATWRLSLVDLSALDRKYTREPWSVRPLLRLDPTFAAIPDSLGHYLCISPWVFMWALAGSAFDIVGLLESKTGENLKTYLGLGIEDYLYDLLARWCGADNVRRIDDIIPGNERRGDLVAFVGSRALLVESTKTIGTLEMRSSVTPTQLLDLWSTLSKKVLQCRATEHHPNFQKLLAERKVEETFSLVCVYDEMLTETPLFVQVAAMTGVVDVQRTEIVSLGELEDIVDEFQAAQVAALLPRKWAQGHGPTSLGVYARENLKPRGMTRPSHDVVRDSALEVIPEFLLTQIEERERHARADIQLVRPATSLIVPPSVGPPPVLEPRGSGVRKG